jgi:HAD superfamily hydrolase (TIGR01450 family)
VRPTRDGRLERRTALALTDGAEAAGGLEKPPVPLAPLATRERPVGAFPAYLFDADGTLVYPHGPVPGAAEAVARLKQAGRRVAVVTNNSFMARSDLHAKLTGFGFPIEPADIFNAPMAAARYVARQRPAARVYAQGSPGLRAELRAAGLRLVSPARAEFLVVGHDPRLTYRKLLVATRGLLAGWRFVAINRDGLIAAPEGAYPGCGMVVGALEAATGIAPEAVAGKPGPLLLEEAARWVGQPPAACLYVGDNLASDLGAARAAGMPCLMVLTGVSRATDLQAAARQPEYVLPSVAELAASLTPL